MSARSASFPLAPALRKCSLAPRSELLNKHKVTQMFLRCSKYIRRHQAKEYLYGAPFRQEENPSYSGFIKIFLGFFNRLFLWKVGGSTVSSLRYVNRTQTCHLSLGLGFLGVNHDSTLKPAER